MSTLDTKLELERGVQADIEFTLVDQFGDVEDLQGFITGRVAFVAELGDAPLVDKPLTSANIEPGGRKGVVALTLLGADTALFLATSVTGKLELDVPASSEKRHTKSFVVLVNPKVI